MLYNKSIKTCTKKKLLFKDLIELLKKAIMYMTLGIDVSILFANILCYVITP